MLAFKCREPYIEQRSFIYFFRQIPNMISSEGGVVAVEFGMLLPVMIIMYFGMAASVIGVEINNKLASTAESIGNLMGRASSVTDNQLLSFFSASGSLLSPYSVTPLKIKIGSISRNKAGVIKKCWGASLSGTEVPSIVTPVQPPNLVELGLPDEIMPSSTTLIVVEASYLYKPPTGYFPDITLTKKYYARARTSTEVSRQMTNGSIISCPAFSEP